MYQVQIKFPSYKVTLHCSIGMGQKYLSHQVPFFFVKIGRQRELLEHVHIK